MLKEFKEFALRGNMLDMAVGIIIGAAFGKIVSSFVTDLLSPPLSFMLGRANLVNLFINLSGGSYGTLAEAKEAGAATLNYGIFLNTVADFLLVSLAVFLLVRQVNRFKRQQAALPPSARECPFCVSSVSLRATRCPHCTSELKAA